MMKRPLIISILLVLVLSVLIWNCETKQKSLGEDDIIYVFADSLDWLEYEQPFNEIFGQLVRTPIMEPEYILVWKPFRQFDNYKHYKNLFIIGRLDAADPVSKNVQNLLNPEVVEGVESGKYFYIPKPDEYALGQYLMIFVATDRDDMIQKIVDLGELAYQDFRKFYFRRLKEQMYARMEQQDLQDYIERHFPFTMRIQHDYFIANEDIAEKFVWIRRFDPDRSILVHWLPVPEDFELTSRWMIDERNRMAGKVYSGDVVVEDETKAFSTNFKGRPAIRLEGTWKNDSLVLGGPFRNISFVDSETQRVYMIDYYVQAIGQRKIPYLDQLNVIVHTFDVLAKPKEATEPEK